MKTKHVIVWLVCLVFLFGCGKDEPRRRHQQFASVSLSLTEEGLSKPALTLLDVTKVTMDIKKGDEIIVSEELKKVDGIWQGNFEKLPAGIELEFMINAYGIYVGADGKPVAIFTGTKIQSLVEGLNTIEIPLQSSSVFNENDFPKVNIELPLELLAKSNTDITLNFEDSGSPYVNFIITSDPVSFTPDAGNVKLSSGKGNVVVSYHAPDKPGTYSFSIGGTNDKGNSVIVEFKIVVVAQYSNGLRIDFAPVITKVVISKNNNNLEIMATIVDDGSASDLKFDWSFNGGLTFQDTKVNPATLLNYSSNASGVIHLKVTDAKGGMSELSYNISGQAFTEPVTILTGKSDLTMDLVVDKDMIIEGDVHHDSILVKNNSKITFKGNVYANSLIVRNGTAIIMKNLNVVDNVVIEKNTIDPTNGLNALTVYGDSNSATTVEVYSKGAFNLSGVWNVRDFSIFKEGKVQLIANTSAYAGSGTFELLGNKLIIESDAVLSADGVGADPRGYGGGYGATGGGAHCGNGGRGYYSATHPGSLFEDAYSHETNMGSIGGYYGGGKLYLELSQLILKGSITSNGIGYSDDYGGGSGGGILIDSKTILLEGHVKANGGNTEVKNGAGGGGGGGCIKIFYENGVSANLLENFSVKGGVRGGYRNTTNGEDGSIWIDAIPKSPILNSPDNNSTISQPVFNFTVKDDSVINDGRNDDLSTVIELSQDNFLSVWHTYDQTLDLTGWSDLSYQTDDVVEFTPPDTLPSGTYQWRAYTKDKSVISTASETRTFIVP